MAPVSWNGSEMLYKRVIRPFFLKHEAAMDHMVSDLSSKAKNLTETVTKEGEMTAVYMQVEPHIVYILLHELTAGQLPLTPRTGLGDIN